MSAVMNEEIPTVNKPKGRPSKHVEETKKILAENPYITLSDLAAQLKTSVYRTKLIMAVARGERPTIKMGKKKPKKAKAKIQVIQPMRELKMPPAPTVIEMPKSPLDKILDERGKRYGTFLGHATVTQQLKKVLDETLCRRGGGLEADQYEALDMICHKIGRIVNGDPDYVDSWQDIAGYAQLVADRLEGAIR
jgi:hypothetical protein